MNALDVVETLADRVQDSARDVASDVDRAARAAAERAQAEARRAIDQRFETDRRRADRRQLVAVVGIGLVVVAIGMAILIARRRSPRVQRLLRRVRRVQPAAWGSRHQPDEPTTRETRPLARSGHESWGDDHSTIGAATPAATTAIGGSPG